MNTFRVIDSHTAGEPTRTIVSGVPDALGNFGTDATATEKSGRFSVKERLELMRMKFDHYRRALVNEPRGSEVMVGALLVPPQDPANLAGVIFFNNVGYLGMCGHGTIGVVETLRYLGWMLPGRQTLETCVGLVQVQLHEDHRVTVENVPSYRAIKRMPLSIEGLPELHADIAWGGNWFCLIECPDPTWLEGSANDLVELSQRILAVVRETNPEVDHVELFGPPKSPGCDSRSFVLCPGGAYDRSPCGTGTSAKLACLAADKKLKPKTVWRQESYIGSSFEAEFQWHDEPHGVIAPSITSRAFVNADLQVLCHDEDPFAWGISTTR